MNKWDILKLAYRNLWRRKGRTILTTLGVVIGTASIVVMLSLGLAITENQRKNMERWGNLNIVRVMAGMRFDDKGQPIGAGKPLNDEAVAEIRSMQGVVAVSPAYVFGGEVRMERKRGYIQLVGIDPSQMQALEFKLSQGRYITPEDKNAIIIGYRVGNNLRDERELRRMMASKGRAISTKIMSVSRPQPVEPAELLGKRLSLLSSPSEGNPMDVRPLVNLEVVGVLDEKDMQRAYEAYCSIDELKQIKKMFEKTMQPAQKSGIPRQRNDPNQPGPDDYQYIMVRASDVGEAKRLSDALKRAGYNAWSMADSLEGIEKQTRTMRAILGGIGGISLFVAALGIANTMVMSIYERTREIGIMKVIGAAVADIRILFLSEASLIGLIGGTLGVGLSYVISYVMNDLGLRFIGMPGPAGPGEKIMVSLIPPWLAIAALGFAIAVGLISGVYPANRAARLRPVKAIRMDY